MKLKLFSFFVVFLTSSINTNAQWQQTNGPNGGAVSCLTVIDNKIFAGTWGNGVFVSTNNGERWNTVNSGLPTNNPPTNEIYIHITALEGKGKNIFVAIENRGVYYSTDFGASWEERCTGLPRDDVYNNYYEVRSLLIDSTNIFAVLNSKGVYRSTDNGNSWALVTAGLNLYVNSLTKYGKSILAGTGNDGIYVSTNNGETWTQLNSSKSVLYINSLVTYNEKIYAGTEQDGIFFSPDSGATWAPLSNGLPKYIYTDNFFNTHENYYSVKKVLIDNGHVLGILDDGLYVFSEDQQTWTKYNQSFPISGLLCFARLNSFLFVGTGNGVLRSSDSDQNWATVNNGLANSSVLSLCVNNGMLYAGTTHGVAFTDDGGNTWSEYNTIVNTYDGFWSVASSDSKIITGTAEGKIYLSTNNGETWKKVNSGLPADLKIITSILVKDKYVFIGTYMAGVFSLCDGDTTWIPRNDGFPYYDKQTDKINLYVRSLISKDDIIFAGGDGGIYFSINNGKNWHKSRNNLSTFCDLEIDSTTFKGYATNYVLSMSVIKDKIFAGTLGGGVFVSDNNGLTWKQVSKGLPFDTDSGLSIPIYSLLAQGNNLFASIAKNGVYTTTDFGNNWKAVNEGLRTVSAYSLASNNQYLFLGADYIGVWRRPLSEMITSINMNKNEVSNSYFLSQNYPNPFNPNTIIRYQLPVDAEVSLKVYDTLGRVVAVLVNEKKTAGGYEVKFTSSGLSSGVYFYRIQTGSFSQTKKFVLLK